MPEQSYGGAGDISATLTGGGFGGDSQGRDITAVLVSRAAPDAEAEPNTAIPINSQITSSGVSTVRAFGERSQMAEQLQRALTNHATPGLLYGVAPEEVSATDEQIAAGSAILNNAPIVANPSDVEITGPDGDGGTITYTPNFVYESLPTVPSGEEEVVNINPNTGEVEGPTDDDLDISYKYLDYDSAIEAAGDHIGTGDAAAIVVDAMSAGVAEKLEAKLREIRPRWSLALGGTIAEPNATNANGEPAIDVEEYTDAVDYDGMMVFPGGTITPRASALNNSGTVSIDAETPLSTVAGGLLGVMASNELTDSIYHDVIEGYDAYRLTQSFSPAEVGDQQNPASTSLRGQELAPIGSDSPDGTGNIKILDDLTTSTATDWLRTHHRRQVADNVLLNFRDLAKRIEDNAEFQTNSQLDEVKQAGLEIMAELAADGVIMSSASQSDTGSTATGIDVTGATPATNIGTGAESENSGEDGEEQFYAVEVSRASINALEIQFAYEPTPVTKAVHLSGAVYDQIPSVSGSTTSNTTGPDSVGSSTGTV